MIDLLSLCEQANELTPLPASTVRLAELVANPDYHLDDVAELIAFDQALTLKLLRAANSAADGSAARVGNVREAVTRMGATRVLALAVAAGVKALFQSRIPAYGLDEGALWRHSVAAAVAAETIQAFVGIATPPETFTAALLHDVGKLVLGRFLSPEILGYIQMAQEADHLSRLEAESLLLNVHHAELGGLIAQHWMLPPRVVQGITYHHSPDQGFDVICDLTYVADQIAQRIEAGLDGRPWAFTIEPGAAQRLDLPPKKLDDLCPVAVSRYMQVSLRYNAV